MIYTGIIKFLKEVFVSLSDLIHYYKFIHYLIYKQLFTLMSIMFAIIFLIRK